MALTHEDVKLLTKPFAASAHLFINGNAYLNEQAIADRLDEVDPSWEFKIVSVVSRDNAGKGGKDVGTVTVHATLTIKGVSRDGVGMNVIQQTNPIYVKDKDGKVTGQSYTNEANEGEKSAATDAFKRAFRMFGGGRYLLTIPKQNGKSIVNNTEQMKAWLKANYPDVKETVVYQDEGDSQATDEMDAWNGANSTAFFNYWTKDRQYTKDAILEALKVKSGKEWKGTLTEAQAAMEKFAELNSPF